MSREVDILVIGSGAGGGPLSLTLSQAGFRVLVLEKGPRYTRLQYQHDEVAVAPEMGFFHPFLSEDPRILCSKEKSEPSLIGWVGHCVGGGTVRMGAALYRFHPGDFQMKTSFGAYEQIEDWPYTYDELEPYYTLAEYSIGISGLASGNPFAGRRSSPFPMPPLKSHPLTTMFDNAVNRLGLHPFSTPRAINSESYDNRTSCQYCPTCTGYGCPFGARGSTQETVLAKAERTGKCEIRANAMVREVTVSSSGRVDGCIYIAHDGVEQRVSAKIVCVCCSAVESARLLLLSTSRLFPDGLANGSGLVGQNLQFHAVSSGKGMFATSMRSTQPSQDRYYSLGRSVMDHYFLPSSVSDISKGGLLRFDVVRPNPIGTAQLLAWDESGFPLWGEPLKRKIREYFLETVEVEYEVFHDFIPSASTYMTLDPTVHDRWGLPAARIYLGQLPHHKLAGAWLAKRGADILVEMGANRVRTLEVAGVVPFLVHGTCRAGHDKSKSVLNGFCQSHEIPNLFVVDGSFMPTSGGAPTTLTILANSFRTADYIIDCERRGILN